MLVWNANPPSVVWYGNEIKQFIITCSSVLLVIQGGDSTRHHEWKERER